MYVSARKVDNIKKSLYRKLRCRNQRGIVNSFQQCIRQVYVSARKVDNIKKSLYRKLRCRNQRGIRNSFQQCIRQVYVSARKVDKKVSVQEIKLSQSAWHCEFLPTMHKTNVCICEEGRQYKKVSVQEIKMSQSAWHCEFYLPTMH